MKLVKTFSTNQIVSCLQQDRPNEALGLIENFVASSVSALNNFETSELITDSKGYDLIKNLNIPFDKISTELDNKKGPFMTCHSDRKQACMQRDPFTYISDDVVLVKKLPFWFLNSKVHVLRKVDLNKHEVDLTIDQSKIINHFFKKHLGLKYMPNYVHDLSLIGTQNPALLSEWLAKTGKLCSQHPIVDIYEKHKLNRDPLNTKIESLSFTMSMLQKGELPHSLIQGPEHHHFDQYTEMGIAINGTNKFSKKVKKVLRENDLNRKIEEVHSMLLDKFYNIKERGVLC